MQKIKIFLASSIIEFKNERDEIGDSIRKIQDVLIDEGIRINLFECEFADNSIVLGRKQEEYNGEIRTADAFIMLVGKTIGKYTLEEFAIAKQSNLKEVLVIFKDVESDDTVKKLQNEIYDDNFVYSLKYKNTEELLLIIEDAINRILKKL